MLVDLEPRADSYPLPLNVVRAVSREGLRHAGAHHGGALLERGASPRTGLTAAALHAAIAVLAPTAATSQRDWTLRVKSKEAPVRGPLVTALAQR